MFAPHMTTPSTRIYHDSVELVCFHEAGHAVAALLAGARVTGMKLLLDPPPARGVTSVITADFTQRLIVAQGGFAVERRLWEDGLLVGPGGGSLAQPDMIQRAAAHADEDRRHYLDNDPGSSPQQSQREQDLQFMSEARELGQNLPMAAVMLLGQALLEKRELGEAEIKAIYAAA